MRRGAARSSGGSAGAQLTDDGDRDLAENEVARGDVAGDLVGETGKGGVRDGVRLDDHANLVP